MLDPAFAALLKHLKERGPAGLDASSSGPASSAARRRSIRVGGRDHWPHGFTVALAGGGIRGGRVIGETSPNPKLDENTACNDLADPSNVEDIHATVLHALGIDFTEDTSRPSAGRWRSARGR